MIKTVSALGLFCAFMMSQAVIAEPLIELHTQLTSTLQAHPAFRGAPDGPNSLSHKSDAAVTNDLTAYIGISPWSGGEIWFNPEIDQGFGLSDTLGVAGFPSGEAYKVGKLVPYYRSQRLFMRQTIGLGGVAAQIDGTRKYTNSALGPGTLRYRQCDVELHNTRGVTSVFGVYQTEFASRVRRHVRPRTYLTTEFLNGITGLTYSRRYLREGLRDEFS